MLKSLCAALLAVAAMSPAGAVVINSLPYAGTPDWIDFQFDGTWSTTPGGASVLNTASAGIWFGNGNYTDGSPPSWSISPDTIGSKLELSMHLVAGSRDWGAYMGDGSRYADIEFNPTYGCNGNYEACYFAPYHAGVSMLFADPNNLAVALVRFVPLDVTVDHSFGFLLKNNLVAYHVDGEVFSGYALASAGNVLVIGDGSGSTLTGSGSMIVNSVSFDTAPTGNVVLGVPEPAAWGLMLIGFGGVGALARRQRRAAARFPNPAH